MASHYQAVPPLRYQQKNRHANNVVKISTQLSINRNDSPTPLTPPLTSAKLLTYSSNSYTITNNNENLLFPLEKRHETFPTLATKISWQDLLQYLKSQRIVKNMEDFKKVHKNHYEITEHQKTFPWANKSSYSMTNFPCQISIKNNYDFQIGNEKFQQNSTENLKKFKLPLKQPSAGQKNRFLFKSKSIKEKSKTHKNVKLQKLNTNLESLGSIVNFRNYSKPKELKKVLFMKKTNKNFTHQIPLQNITFSFNNNKRELPRFPQTLSPTLGKFPVRKQKNNKDIQTNLIHENRIKTLKLYNKYEVNFENKYDFKKFPCKKTIFKQSDLNKFPLKVQVKNSNSISDKSLISLTASEPVTSLAVTFKGQHVSQVQDAQIQPISTTFEHKQTPPQTTFLKTFNDVDNDVYKLPAISAINNTRSNEVGLFEEKIERIQDAIVALFEKIQNSFRKTHIVSEHDEKAHAAINRNDDGNSSGNGVARFALTPPTNSITSVRNTERTLVKENNNDVHNKNMYNDLGDLWHDASDQHGKIVESSDVRDTLAEAVDYGVKNRNPITSTGSFLVKSEEPIPPHTPLPQILTKSITTSLERSDILPKYNVLPVNLVSGNDKNNLEVDISTKLNACVTDEISTETEIRVKELSAKEESEMTITRLEDNENNCLQSRETFVEPNNTLVNDIEIDEMKYEMNRTKGALPSTLTDSRAVGKHETLKTGNANANYNRNISSNVAIRPSRDINSSTSTPSATQRLSLKSEKLHSPINTYTPPDITTNRPSLTTSSNILNDSVASRSITPSQKTLNTSNDILANRRPSLSSLRNTQSTSLLSQDLAHYSPALTTNQKDQKTALSRGASVDSSLEGVLPERTRLRRQRRLRPQDSKDEPEDPIERLNRLKARISASLSEVKGVLKQYSTDGENENDVFNTPMAVNAKETQQEENKKEGPVTFRFVKKIRRRSVFADEEEENKQKKDTNTGIDEVDHQHRGTDVNLETEKIQKLEVAKETKNDELVREKSVKRNDSDDDLKNIHNKEINTNLYTLKEEVQESLKETPSQLKEENKTENKNLNVDVAKLEKPESIELRKDTSPDSKVKTKKQIIESKDALLTLESSTISIQKPLKETPLQTEEKIEQKMGESKAEDVNRQSEIIKEDEKKPQTFKEETQKGAIPKQTESELSSSTSEPISDSKNKNRRKVVIKPKDPSRRASLAAVEGSKIEPPVKVAMPAKIIRRPSDSEAVVKKKLITAKINTSGSIEEVTPKPKIVKVKRPSTKSNAQLATTQTKTIKEEESVVTTANNQSNDRVKSTDEQKTINSDENKDVLLPKELKNNEITSQTNLLLPTQLVINEAASLKAKTIENSQLQSNQEQEQVQKQTQQQATIKSTTTKFYSNELQQTCGDGDAMLENLTTTAISSTKTTEANGQQIKRENVKAVQEDLHDLLQQETTIVKPSATKQVGEKFLEKDHQKHLQQQTNLAQQQVVATTDVVVVKNDDVSNNSVNEIDKTKRSSKEPCAIKSPTTSTHVVAHEHHTQLAEGEQSITHKTDTKAISSPHISISSTADSIQNTTKTVDDVPLKESREEVNQSINTMPELQLAPAPVQTAEVSPQPEHNKKKIVLKKIVRQASIDKTKKPEPDVAIAKDQVDQNSTAEIKDDISITPVPDRALESPVKDESTEDISESTEVSESSTSQGSEEAGATNHDKPKKERKIKKKVIIKRQKRRLSIGDTFFHPTTAEEPQNAEVETLEKAIAYFTDDDDDGEDDEADSEIATEEDEETKKKALEEEEKQKKPLKSCIMHKEYNIGDEVLYAERFKKTQIKWRRGRIKERITSISYLLDIDGKDVSSHINYLKKFTGRKVSFGGKEYLEIDYEQLAEEEEKAEKLQRRSYSIWNMV